MITHKFIAAAAVALLLAGPAIAQGWGPSTAGPSTAGPGAWYPQPAPSPPIQTYELQPQHMPQSWTGNQVGGTTFWNGSNGGSVTCNRVGAMTFCN